MPLVYPGKASFAGRSDLFALFQNNNNKVHIRNKSSFQSIFIQDISRDKFPLKDKCRLILSPQETGYKAIKKPGKGEREQRENMEQEENELSAGGSTEKVKKVESKKK